jgi:hypothetical protein
LCFGSCSGAGDEAAGRAFGAGPDAEAGWLGFTLEAADARGTEDGVRGAADGAFGAADGARGMEDGALGAEDGAPGAEEAGMLGAADDADSAAERFFAGTGGAPSRGVLPRAVPSVGSAARAETGRGVSPRATPSRADSGDARLGPAACVEADVDAAAVRLSRSARRSASHLGHRMRVDVTSVASADGVKVALHFSQVAIANLS